MLKRAGNKMDQTFVIIGAGHAGGQAAATLRSKGFEGKIIMIGDEAYAPYERPPLSKALLAGEIEIERLYLKKPSWYPDKDIDLRVNTLVDSINKADKTLALSDGSTVAYDKLLIATGTRVRKLALPGAELGGIFYLRAIADTLAIQERMTPSTKIVIVGGGYIGLEVAAVGAKMGCDVTVLEGLDRVMNRVVSPEVSAFYHDIHTKAGVKIITGVGVTAYEGDGDVSQVICADGSAYDADLVVVGVGVIPNCEIADEAGLKVENGLVVDEFAQTSDPDIYAAGDVTNHPNALLGRRLRLESVQNAVDQAKTAANAMLGTLKEYAEIPWFWSDQYDLKLQIVGLSEPDDDVVVRGDPETKKFSVCYLRDGELVAVNAINNVKDFMGAKKLIAAHRKIDPTLLADADTPLKQM
jgi:3-phenylpropionate/trans-cinnamate dioxygenase ferredoxin reductase component